MVSLANRLDHQKLYQWRSLFGSVVDVQTKRLNSQTLPERTRGDLFLVTQALVIAVTCDKN